jgi:hypothetical protein
MEERKPVHVDGAITKTCLRSVIELQDAWSLWRPDKYHKFPITAREYCDPVRPGIQSVACAFSGGVDAAFSLLRHAGGMLGHAGLPVKCGVLVHGFDGFDMALEKQQSFHVLANKCRRVLDMFGIDLVTMRTDIRAITQPKWVDAFAAQLACCLHQLDPVCDAGIIGSSEPYDQLFFPWGSTPATDHLLSGGSFQIFHDGAANSRTAKVAQLAAFPEVIAGLKFCLAEADKNCGACEKCLRTYLNFCASGIDAPQCMPKPSIKQLSTIPLHNQIQVNEISQALAYAMAHERTGDWFRAAERSIAAYKTNMRNAALRARIREIPYIGPTLRAANKALRTHFVGRASSRQKSAGR